MRHTFLCAIMALFPVGLATGIEVVSLSKFNPRVENLPASCQIAYVAPIKGCTREELPTTTDKMKKTCSTSCVNGLNEVVELVKKQCTGVRVPSLTIIGRALLGTLVQDLCANTIVVTTHAQPLPTSSTSTKASTTQQAQSSSTQEEYLSSTQEEQLSSTQQEQSPSTQQEQSPSTQQEQSSESSQATGSAPSASSSSAPASAANPPNQTTQSAPSSTGQGLLLDSGRPPQASSPSATPIGQKSNPDSGGGSPFDIRLSDATSRLEVDGLIMASIFGTAICSILFL